MHVSLMEIIQVLLFHTIFHAEYTRTSCVGKPQRAKHIFFCISIDKDSTHKWISDGSQRFSKIMLSLSSQSIYDSKYATIIYTDRSMSAATHKRIANRTRSWAAAIPGRLEKKTLMHGVTERKTV